MNFFIEFIVELLITIVVEVAFGLIFVIFENLNPFKKAYNKTIEDGTDDKFKMVLNSNVRGSYWAGIIFAGLILIIGDISFPLAYVSDKINTTLFVIMILIFQILCLPAILFCINGSLKTIYFTENNIVYKTLFRKKKIEIDKIKCAIEDSKKIIIVYNGKCYKIGSYFSNYDKASANLKKLSCYKFY